MIKKLIPLIAVPAVMIMGSCASRMETAGKVDQHDDVYYSKTVAKEEAEVIESRNDDNYVTDEELYGDAYSQGDYAARIYRFRNYSPWRNYYSPIYTYYDPFMRNDFYFGPRNYIGLNFGYGPFNYGYGYGNYYGNSFYGLNPWRNYPFGYNSYNNFWGPYSYYNNWGGIGYNGGGSYYVDRNENYRSRPVRSGDNTRIDRGAFAPGAGTGTGAVIRDGNGAIISTSRGRAESYRPETRTGSGAVVPRTSTTRSTVPSRPDRVNNAPTRTSQPERMSPPPSRTSEPTRSSQPSSGGSSSGGGRSNDGGGGARPSRGN